MLAIAQATDQLPVSNPSVLPLLALSNAIAWMTLPNIVAQIWKYYSLLQTQIF
jgi:hypothetical protein